MSRKDIAERCARYCRKRHMQPWAAETELRELRGLIVSETKPERAARLARWSASLAFAILKS